jgi:hypothetical protein
MDLNSNPSGLELALYWAENRHPVLPVASGSKRPLIKAWQQHCSTDPDQIRAWWQRYPDARVGIATGHPGFDVVDFDVANNKPGMEQLERLLDAGVFDPSSCWLVSTPSGGRHLYFTGSDQRNKQNEEEIPGVDFRGGGGMVLAAGNPGYRVIRKATVLGGVLWTAVRALLAPPEIPPANPQPPARPSMPPAVPQAPRVKTRLSSPNQGYDNPIGEESPLDWYGRNHDLDTLLTQAGWTYIGTEDENRRYRRPGKDDPGAVSATVKQMADGRTVLYVFSSSVHMPVNQALSVGQAYAWMYHNGDLRAAASEIRRSLMPQRPRVPPVNYGAPVWPAVPPAPSVGSEIVPAGAGTVPEQIRGFWQRRPELAEVWWRSQVGGVSPWAVLGTVLAEVAGRLGPHVVLPPLGGVGGAASLNVLVAISGNSGTGKGRSNQVAREFVGSPNPPHRKPGTGQGIAAIFTEQTKEGPVQSGDTVVLNVAEITQLGAHMGQQGATITSTLLEVYMGEELGEHYANKELRRPVKEGKYRLALVAGVQPDNAGILFDHAASGLPQRFLWMPALWIDAILPESGLRPPAPGSQPHRWRAWPEVLPGTLDDTIEATGWSPSDAAGGLSRPGKTKEPEAIPAPVKETLMVSYAPMVQRTINQDHTRRLNAIKRRILAGEDDPGDPDSHLLLTRIKVATLLSAWLDNTTRISDEMWELASWVIWISNDTRVKAQTRIRAKNEEKNRSRAAAQIAQRAAIDEDADRRHTGVYVKALERATAVVNAAGDWISTGNVSRRLASKEKKAMRDAGVDLADVLADLVSGGVLISRETEKAGNPATEWRSVK